MSIELLIDLALKNHALRFGDFSLKSGRHSPYVFDTSYLLQCSQTWSLLANMLAKHIYQQNWSIHCLLGPAYQGIPLVSATACAWSTLGYGNLHIAFNRKAGHLQTQPLNFVGKPPQGRLAILDDTLVSGAALQHTEHQLQQVGAELTGVCLVFDRQEPFLQSGPSAVTKMCTAFHKPITSLITLSDVIAYCASKSTLQEAYQRLQAYQSKLESLARPKSS